MTVGEKAVAATGSSVLGLVPGSEQAREKAHVTHTPSVVLSGQ